MAKNSYNDSSEYYYTLRPLHINTRGQQLMAGTDTIRIGQTADSDWRFDNATAYADEVYAVIRPRTTSASPEWMLIPVSEHVAVSVNGTRVNLIHYLRDGDVIAFDGERQELRYNVHHDGRYRADIGTAYIPVTLSPAAKRWITAVAVIVAVVIVGGVWLFANSNNKRQQIVRDKLNTLSASVFQITVDTVWYVATATSADGTTITDTLGRYCYESDGSGAVSGTAFIADDTLLVTARHCIEPWLNDTTIEHAACPEELSEGPVRWAFEAETINQLDGSSSRRLISVCTIWGGETNTKPIARYTSDDFSVDRSRDDIVAKGNFYSSCYWRNIWRRGELKAQTLGDVACVTLETRHESPLHIATAAYMEGLRKGRTIWCLGYPDYQEKGYSYEEGMLQKDYVADELLSHGGNIIHGYSGGPVVVFDEDPLGNIRATVVGIISVTDSRGASRHYSVPATEIQQ